MSVFFYTTTPPPSFSFRDRKTKPTQKIWRSSPGELLVAGKAIIIVFSDLSARASKKGEKRGKKKESNRRFCFSIVPGQDTRFLVYRRELPLTFLALDPPDGQKGRKSKNTLVGRYAAEHCRPMTCLDFPPNPEKMFPTRPEKKKKKWPYFSLCVYKVRSPK